MSTGYFYIYWYPILFQWLLAQACAIAPDIIPHLHNLFLFQCDLTCSLNRYEAWSKLFIDQGRTTLYRQLRYIGQYRWNAVLT